MNIFLKKNMQHIRQCQHDYLAQKHHCELAQKKAKQHCHLLMGKPEVLFGIFTAGAYSGATSHAPSKKRNNALVTLARTALISLLK